MKLRFTQNYIYILILILKQSIGILNINNNKNSLNNNINNKVNRNNNYLANDE